MAGATIAASPNVPGARRSPVPDRPVETDGPAQRTAIVRALAAARVVHPFPSILDGLVVGVVATVAGAVPALALLLGVSMTLLQFAIGTLNDLTDAPRDAMTRRRKPIPDGLVRVQLARAVVAVCAGGGLLLALVGGGPLLLFVAAVGLAIGAWYDLFAKGTWISWLPMAVGVPLLPVFGWLGATGTLPSAFAVLVPAAILAGAALAIANATVDTERDVAAGVTSLAVVLGPVPASLIALALQVVVAIVALASGSTVGGSGTWVVVAVGVATVPVAGAILGVAVSRRGPSAREVAFEVQAVGLALLVVA
jgi:4-hydroxybenzoate polyprenyltransferase